MGLYVLMSKLSPSTMRDPRGRREAGHAWLKKVEDLCPGLRWVAHYALLGPYDFMDVYEAADPEMPFRVSLVSRELGAVTAESWPAVKYEAFVPLAEKVDEVVRRHVSEADAKNR